MVRAILAGTKTQTRRLLYVPTTRSGCFDRRYEPPPIMSLPVGQCWTLTQWKDVKPGDQLWGRENGWERPERPERTPKMMREGADTWKPYYFDADGYGEADRAQFKEWGFKRRPSIHMPRWASRITLEIVSVRVERLQDISQSDCLAEGISLHPIHFDKPRTSIYSPYQTYCDLWEQINGLGSWNENPWVWVVAFRKIKP